MLNVWDFIQVYVFSTNHHLNALVLENEGVLQLLHDEISYNSLC